MAISHATCQAIWLRNLLEGLGYLQKEPTVLYSDNQSAINLTQDTQFHARSRHFDVQNYFVREKVENKIIDSIIYIPTDDNTLGPYRNQSTRSLGRILGSYEYFYSEWCMTPDPNVARNTHLNQQPGSR